MQYLDAISKTTEWSVSFQAKPFNVMIIQVYTLTSNAEEAEVEPKQEFGWTLGVGDGEGGLACYDSWGRKELDTTERLNWTELKQ